MSFFIFRSCFVCFFILMGLTACTGSGASLCPPLVTYTPTFHAKLAAEIESLPENSALLAVVGDYIALRDQLRQCQMASRQLGDGSISGQLVMLR